MKIISKKIAFFIFLLVANNAIAQVDTTVKADSLFNELLYAEAISEYEELLKTGIDSVHVNQKLAECHLMMKNEEKASPYIKATLLATKSPPTAFYQIYSASLYKAGDSTEAEKWFKKYEALEKNDSEIETVLENDTLATVEPHRGAHYKIETVHFNSIYSDFGTYVKNDTIYYSSARTDGQKERIFALNGEPWLDIYSIRENDALASPTPLLGDVNSQYHESSLTFSINHKKEEVIYFTGNKYFKFTGKDYLEKKKRKDSKASLNLKIFSAVKSAGEWKVNQDLIINSDEYSTGHPYVTADGKRLYFTSSKAGGYGGSDIYYAPIHERGGIGKPVNAGPIVNTAKNEMFPFVHKDGRLFFTSDGHEGHGNLDIYSTVLNSEKEIVSILNLGMPINSSSDDFAYFENTAGGSGYISSNREGGVGSDDIYKFNFTPALSIEGNITDLNNDEPLDSVVVTVYNEKNNTIIAKLTTDKNGYYQTNLARKSSYRVETTQKNYSKTSDIISTLQTPSTVSKILLNVRLDPIKSMKTLANLNKINFDSDKDEISPDAALELDKVVQLFNTTYPNMKINIAVHTAMQGGDTINDEVSERRAKAIYDYLIKNGVNESSILSHKGYGKRKSINNCAVFNICTDEELELSRRVEFEIIQLEENKTILNAAVGKSE